MMSRCLDMDTLVTLGTAVEWKVEEALHHLRECDSCKLQLHQLTAVHGALSEEIKPAPSFVDRVTEALPSSASAAPAAGRLSILLKLLNPILAGMTAFFAVAFVAAAAGPGPSLVPAALLASLIAAGITLWRNFSLPELVSG